MFRINFKIALRNLLKNKAFAAINVIGLALGLCSFVLLLLYIQFEKSYDRWDPELEQVYQVREKHHFGSPDNKADWQITNDSRVAALLKKDIPQFKYTTRIKGAHDCSVRTTSAEPVSMSGFRYSDSNFFKVFPYKFLLGDRTTAFSNLNSVVLKEHTALKLFGTSEVLGKDLKILGYVGDKGVVYKVTGVVEDPVCPESVDFGAIVYDGAQNQDPENLGRTSYCEVYVLSEKGIDLGLLNLTIHKSYLNFKKSFPDFDPKVNEKIKDHGLKILPIGEVHANPPFKEGWVDQIKSVGALSLFLLVVSIINFVNLATAKSVQRAKEVGVKKVLGASRKSLTWQFLIEAAFLSFAALFLSIVFVELLLPFFNSHFDLELSLWHNREIFMIGLELLAILVIVTIMAGIYPALVLSSYRPVEVLKGSYTGSFKGSKLRYGLVIVQFVITVTFMICMGIMMQQGHFIHHKNLGFDRGRLINLPLNYNETFAQRLKKIPGVQYVGTTTQVMGNVFNVDEEGKYKQQIIHLNMVTVSMETLAALGVQLKTGRLFSREYQQDTLNSVVLNESAAKLFGGNCIGEQYSKKSWDNKEYRFKIIGVIRDYHNQGFDKTVLPTVYKVTQQGGSASTNNLLVRLNVSDMRLVIKQIEKEWRILYPDNQMTYVSVEDVFKKELKTNDAFIEMIACFSFVSVFISLMGLFALSAFVISGKTKELAIRKVLGASNIQILNLLSRSFLYLVFAANLVGWPLAYIFASQWLSGFAYRVDITAGPFFITAGGSLLIALLTVGSQAGKAAVSNPVKALKYE